MVVGTVVVLGCLVVVVTWVVVVVVAGVVVVTCVVVVVDCLVVVACVVVVRECVLVEVDADVVLEAGTPLVLVAVVGGELVRTGTIAVVTGSVVFVVSGASLVAEP